MSSWRPTWFIFFLVVTQIFNGRGWTRQRHTNHWVADKRNQQEDSLLKSYPCPHEGPGTHPGHLMQPDHRHPKRWGGSTKLDARGPRAAMQRLSRRSNHKTEQGVSPESETKRAERGWASARLKHTGRPPGKAATRLRRESKAGGELWQNFTRQEGLLFKWERFCGWPASDNRERRARDRSTEGRDWKWKFRKQWTKQPQRRT